MGVKRLREKSETLINSNCSLCGSLIAPEVQALTASVDARVLRLLQRKHPGDWEGAVACPECVHKAMKTLRSARSRISLQDKLLLPYPVYDPNEIHLLPAHQIVDASPQYTGEGVTMAFLDSGFYPHPDLVQPENRILCYVDAARTQPVEKTRFRSTHFTSWHGLMTASVAAGNGTLSEQLYRGIAYKANLVLVKTGSPSGRGIREADILRALEWVVANQTRFNIRVVNISLGGDHPSNGMLSPLDRLVEKAVSNGMVVVTASGNDGAERLVPPASAPSAITVGGLDYRNSLDRRLWRMYPSNYGLDVHKRFKPEIIGPATWLAAPMLPRTRIHNEGVLLWQLDSSIQQMQQANGVLESPDKLNSHQQLGVIRRKIRQRMIDQKYIHPHYQHVDGTSMAAPVVSAVIALMLEANPGLTPSQVKEILVNTAVPLDGLPGVKTKVRLVHAGRAVAAARRLSRNILNVHPLSPHTHADQVTFYYFDPDNSAKHIALVGSFNCWNPEGYELRSSSPGFWQLSIPAPALGRHRYKFLVDDGWVHDPENPHRIEDGYGGFSSILDVKNE